MTKSQYPAYTLPDTALIGKKAHKRQLDLLRQAYARLIALGAEEPPIDGTTWTDETCEAIREELGIKRKHK